jgi:cyanophycinase
MIRINSLLAVLGLVACFAGCASKGDSSVGPAAMAPTSSPFPTGTPSGGHLVIVGGGLKQDNADIHYRFVGLCAEGPIGIIPLASGDGMAAGTDSIATWHHYAGEKPVTVIPLVMNSREANDSKLAQRIAACGGLWFTGGDQSRVTAVLKPNGEMTECLKACYAVLAKGGVIGGTSAGAAIMSDPMITGGQSPGRLNRDPDEAAAPVRIGPGLGFLPVGLTDQHFLERGRMGRLITALNQQHIPVGFGIRENCALVVDREHHAAEAMGDRAVCVLAPTTCVDDSSNPALCASLSVLSTGDTVKLSSGEFDPRSITPAHGLIRPAQQPRPQSSQVAATRRVPDPWDKAVVENVLDRLENDPAQITLQSDRVSLEFGDLPSARMFVDPTGKRHACLVNIGVTVRPAPAAVPAQQ